MTPDYEITAMYGQAGADGTASDDAGSFEPISSDRLMEAETLAVKTGDSEELYPFRGENILDLYNELAAITLFRTLGKTREEIARALAGLRIGRSRKEIIQTGEKRIYRMLAKGKNPIAVSRVLEAVDTIPGTKQFILLVDTSTGTVTPEDNAAWTFDADLAILRDPAVKRIVVGARTSASRSYLPASTKQRL